MIKDKDHTNKGHSKGKKKNDSLRNSKTGHADKRAKCKGSVTEKLTRPTAN